MKITVEPQKVCYLLSKLTIVSDARFVQLIANKENQSIYFRGANESVQVITSSVKCEVSESGAFDFDYSVLKDLVSNLATIDFITLDCNDSRIKVTSNDSNGEYNVSTVPSEEVTTDIKTLSSEIDVRLYVDSEALNKSLNFTLKAAPKSDCRMYLNGLNFDIRVEREKKAFLFLVATDGNRLNLKTVPIKKCKGKSGSYIIPNSANNAFVDYLLKMTSTYSGNLMLGFSQDFAEIITPEGDSIRTKLIDHPYAAWEQIVNADTSNYQQIDFNRADFKTVLTRLKSLSSKFEAICGVYAQFNSENVVLSYRSHNGVANGSETLPISNPKGVNGLVGFNAEYMLNLLTLSSAANATLWIDRLNPSNSIIRYKEKNAIGIIMPIR